MSIEVTSNDNQVIEDKNKSASITKVQDENHSEESDTTENDLESLESMDDENESTDDSKSDKGKKKGGFQKRISKLTARLTAAEQRALAAEAALLARQEPAAKETKQAESKPSGKPNPNDFDTNAEYIDALTDWKIEQREAKAKAENEKYQAKTEEQKRIESFQSKVNEFKKEHADFDDVIDDCEVYLSPEFQSLVIESDLAPNILYDLANKPEEIEKLNKLKGFQLAKAVGVLEDRLAKEAESKKAKQTTTSKAPPPISTVGAKGGAIAKKDISDPSLSFSEYEKLRRQQLKKR